MGKDKYIRRREAEERAQQNANLTTEEKLTKALKRSNNEETREVRRLRAVLRNNKPKE